jgi:hypothetical protein
MATVRLRNINPLGRVDLPLIGRQGEHEGEGVACLEPGEVFEVDAKVAGRAPSGTPGEADYDLGEGLLAQVGNYELADAATSTRKTRAPKGDS